MSKSRAFSQVWIPLALALAALLPTGVYAWPKILPHHFGRYPVPPRVYGYPFDDNSAGYYGGLRYREYYGFERGYFLARFPDSVPPYDGRWTRWRYWPYPEDERVPAHHAKVPPGCACVEVHVPEDAEVWFEGRRSAQTTSKRIFLSPPLPAGRRFVYEVRARWTEAGTRREQIRQVIVEPDSRVTVSFGAESEPEPAELPTLQPTLPRNSSDPGN